MVIRESWCIQARSDWRTPRVRESGFLEVEVRLVLRVSRIADVEVQIRRDDDWQGGSGRTVQQLETLAIFLVAFLLSRCAPMKRNCLVRYVTSTDAQPRGNGIMQAPEGCNPPDSPDRSGPARVVQRGVRDHGPLYIRQGEVSGFRSERAMITTRNVCVCRGPWNWAG